VGYLTGPRSPQDPAGGDPAATVAKEIAGQLEAALEPLVGRIDEIQKALLHPTTPHPRLSLSPEEAAAVIGCSRTFFEEHVMPELRVVRVGRRRFVPVGEIERWLDANAARSACG
jgi:hypothetical protein